MTWTVSTTPSADFGLDRFTFSDTNKGLLMLYSSVTLYKTTDGGANWTLVPKTGSLFNTNISYIPGTSKVVSCAYANPLGSSYSLNDGLTWTTIDTGVFHGEVGFLNDTFGFSAGMNTDATTGGISKFTGIPLKNPSFDSNKQIAAYPNPTNGMLNLNSETSLIKEVSVFDLLGKQVYKSNFSALNNVNLDLKSLQNGAYLLKVTSDSGKTETIKIMKK
nr:T9SS type A sorting domain-containing protein [uncultured Flavobacterium sp.]